MGGSVMAPTACKPSGPPEHGLQDSGDASQTNEVHIPGPGVDPQQPVGQEEQGGGKEHDPPAHMLQGGKGCVRG